MFVPQAAGSKETAKRYLQGFGRKKAIENVEDQIENAPNEYREIYWNFVLKYLKGDLE